MSTLCTPPLDMSSLSAVPFPNWDAPLPLPYLKRTQTNFDPKAAENFKVNFLRKDVENRWKVTEEERGFAKHCKYPNDLQAFNEDVSFFFLAMKLVLNYFDDQLQKQLSQGFKASPEKYLYFDSAWLDGCVSSELTISKY